MVEAGGIGKGGGEAAAEGDGRRHCGCWCFFMLLVVICYVALYSLSIGYFFVCVFFFKLEIKSSTYLGFNIKKYSKHSFFCRWFLSF